MTQEAERKNVGKAEITQVPPSSVEATARVLTFGAQKYSRGNWRKGGPISQYLDCAYRHLNKIAEGEDTDPESGELHAAHVQCNMAFIIELRRTGKLRDDRPTAAVTAVLPPITDTPVARAVQGKFKTGDFVELREDIGSYRKGDKFTVEKSHSYIDGALQVWTNRGVWFAPHHLRLVDTLVASVLAADDCNHQARR